MKRTTWKDGSGKNWMLEEREGWAPVLWTGGEKGMAELVLAGPGVSALIEAARAGVFQAQFVPGEFRRVPGGHEEESE